MATESLGLFDTPPSRREVRVAQTLVGLLFLAFLAVLPVSGVPTGEVAAFVPVIDAVVAGGELIIATLLCAQAAVFRSRALILLASGFVLIALLLVVHALTFPGAFAPDGLLSPGTSSTAWIMIFRRLGAPLTVMLYALLKDADPKAQPGPTKAPPRVLAWIAGAAALAAVASLLAILGDALLPPIFVNRTDASSVNLLIFNLANIAVVVVAMTVLFVRRRSKLDLWLQVALAGWLIQSVLSLSIHARFTVGWYCLFLVVLVSHLFVLLALITESNRLYARLALSAAVMARERDARMMSMEAVAAAISHEVGQPLAAVTLTAETSLRHLTRAPPQPDRAIASLRDTIEAGRRAFDVLKSVRAGFANRTGPLSDFSLNELVRETSTLLGRELAAQKISLQLALDESLPNVRANRVQIQRVLVNLLTNAIESLGASEGAGRRISIRSTTSDADSVLLAISDSGAGISPDQMARIFDPFYTTKSTGTGLGLSLSRTILEEHGGRLWASNGEEHGATFHVQLHSSHGPLHSDSMLATRH